MIINGVECSDKQATAEHFNPFFASVGELNSRNITDHGDFSYRDYLSKESNLALNSDWLIPMMSNRL